MIWVIASHASQHKVIAVKRSREMSCSMQREHCTFGFEHLEGDEARSSLAEVRESLSVDISQDKTIVLALH